MVQNSEIYKYNPFISLMKLDLYDKKLLYYLDIDSRSSLRSLGKKVRLSKNAVNNRLKKLMSKGVIRQAYSVLNVKKLGYSYFKIYFKLQDTTEEKEKEIIDYFVKNTPSLWINTWDGRYDLMVGILAKSVDSFYEILNTSINKFRKHFQSYDIYIVINAPHFKKDYLIDEVNESNMEEFGGIYDTVNLDKIDEKILRILSTNARIQLVDLAKEINTTIDVARYRVKKFKETGILQGHRILIDYAKLGYQLYKVLITTQNMDEETEKKMITYSAMQPNVADIIIKGIGPWNIELQIDAKNNQDFHKIFKGFKDHFKDVIKNHETMTMVKEYKMNYYPF